MRFIHEDAVEQEDSHARSIRHTFWTDYFSKENMTGKTFFFFVGKAVT